MILYNSKFRELSYDRSDEFHMCDFMLNMHIYIYVHICIYIYAYVYMIADSHVMHIPAYSHMMNMIQLRVLI